MSMFKSCSWIHLNIQINRGLWVLLWKWKSEQKYNRIVNRVRCLTFSNDKIIKQCQCALFVRLSQIKAYHINSLGYDFASTKSTPANLCHFAWNFSLNFLEMEEAAFLFLSPPFVSVSISQFECLMPLFSLSLSLSLCLFLRLLSVSVHPTMFPCTSLSISVFVWTHPIVCCVSYAVRSNLKIKHDTNAKCCWRKEGNGGGRGQHKEVRQNSGG